MQSSNIPALPAFVGAPDTNCVYHADLFTLCAAMPDQSVDMILADLPYGTTACSWDTVIPFEPMWAAFKRIIKPRGAIVLTANQPFTSALVMSWPQGFKYAWVWVKSNPTDFIRAKLKPMGKHEDVLVFSRGTVANGSDRLMNYYPQGLRRSPRVVKNGPTVGGNSLRGGRSFLGRDATNLGPNNKLHQPSYVQEFDGYPNTVLEFASQTSTKHPTQKPIALFRYLIRTYTRAGELVFDPVVGSGTTALAARSEERRFIVGDSSAEYVEIARQRLAQPYTPDMFALAELQGASA